jgi:hypothetical protein
MATQEQHQWLADALGVTSVLSLVGDEKSAATDDAASPVSSETQSATDTAQAGEAAAADAGNSSAPVISVSTKGDGSFVITGSGFVTNTTVHIRVVDDALTTLWFDTGSDGQGKINFPVSGICKLPGNLHFSANDGRPDPSDLTGTLWSNTVTASCPNQPADPGDDPDDPDPPDNPTPPSDPAPAPDNPTTPDDPAQSSDDG